MHPRRSRASYRTHPSDSRAFRGHCPPRRGRYNLWRAAQATRRHSRSSALAAQFSARRTDRFFPSLQRSLGGSSRTAAGGFARILRADCGIIGPARRGDRLCPCAVRRIIMKKRAIWIAICAFLGAVAAVSAQQSQPPAPPQPPEQNNREGAIVRNVNLVEVLFSVVTKHEKLVTDLQKENFKAFDDNVQQEVTSFSQPTDLPLRIGMVL